jgi:hypothetical protein
MLNNMISVATLHYLLEYVDLLLSLLQLVRKSRRLCCLLLQLLGMTSIRTKTTSSRNSASSKAKVPAAV